MAPTAERCGSFFAIREADDPDGALRVTLLGEIDMAVTDQLTTRLGQLTQSARRVRLDLSQPEFIDCSGLGAIITALTQARRAGCALSVDRRVSPTVARIIILAGVASDLWPAAAVAADRVPRSLPLVRPSRRQPRHQGVSAHA
jgi:anti-anti-sigma factor